MKTPTRRVIFAAVLLLPLSLTYAEEGKMAPRDVVKAFAEIYGKEMHDVARREHWVITKEHEEVLDAVKALDWPKTKERVKILFAKSGQYKTSGGKVEPRTPLELRQYAMELYGTLEQLEQWKPSLLEMYAEDIMSMIPSNAVYIGGTDPGRFVISAYQTVYKKPFFVLTQNALSVEDYVSYARTRVGQSIWLPSKVECGQALTNFISDVRSGRQPSYMIEESNGSVSLKGPEGYMAMNGVVAKMIFERNKTNHEFYVEESYVIAWMYPYLEPAGLIMKLNAEPKALSEETVAKDRKYWDAYVKRLTSHPDYAQDTTAKKTYSKLRSSIAGIYVSRGMLPEAEYAFRQSLQLCPDNAEGSFRLADLYMRQRRFDDACLLMEQYQKVDPANTYVTERITQMKAYARDDARMHELEKACAKGGDSSIWTELALARLNTGRMVEALVALRKAVDLGGDTTRAQLRKDPRFQNLWKTPAFQTLTQPTEPPNRRGTDR